MVRYAILGLLREGADYGYRLKRRFDERVGSTWRLGVGQVYQTLRSLERAGLVRSARAAADDEHPERRLYEVTRAGLEVLDRWAERPPRRAQPVRDETVVRLLLLDAGGRGALLSRLTEQERRYRRRLVRLVGQKRRLERGGRPSVRRLGLEAALLHTEAHLRWLASCRERLHPLAAAPAASEGRAAVVCFPRRRHRSARGT
jgi:DNA-binding PadR family transcriptional regulator